MKKSKILAILVLMLAFLFITSQVFASPAAAPDFKNTPGAKATEKAVEKDTQGTGNPHGKPANLKGTLTAVGADSLTVTLDKDGTVYNVVLTADTKIKIPTLGLAATVADLKVGMKAMVHTRLVDGKYIAWAVNVIPATGQEMEEEFTVEHTLGTVSAYEAGKSITILSADGVSTTYTLTEGIKILPAKRAGLLSVDAKVTIILADDGTTVKGIVVQPK